MKIKLEDSVPLPEDWQSAAVRGNTGYGPMLRGMTTGQSFKVDVTDEKSRIEMNTLRSAVYALRSAKHGRKNFIIRLVEHDPETDYKVYRVWATPLINQE